VVAIFLSPVIGFAIAMFMVLITSWLFKGFQPRRAEGVFKALHLVSSAAYSISHGGNDAQKTMGIITVLLYSTGQLGGEFHVPEWVVISCYLAISLGTLSGGWKIIKTMGTKITKLNHHTGFCASTAGSCVVFGASALGIPISTTHAITGSVIGTGAARRASAVRWGVAGRVVTAWFITIPASAAVGAVFYVLTKMF
jgi:inorganic phosphate transporter, PiT family